MQAAGGAWDVYHSAILGRKRHRQSQVPFLIHLVSYSRIVIPSTPTQIHTCCIGIGIMHAMYMCSVCHNIYIYVYTYMKSTIFDKLLFWESLIRDFPHFDYPRLTVLTEGVTRQGSQELGLACDGNIGISFW